MLLVRFQDQRAEREVEGGGFLGLGVVVRRASRWDSRMRWRISSVLSGLGGVGGSFSVEDLDEVSKAVVVMSEGCSLLSCNAMLRCGRGMPEKRGVATQIVLDETTWCEDPLGELYINLPGPPIP